MGRRPGLDYKAPILPLTALPAALPSLGTAGSIVSPRLVWSLLKNPKFWSGAEACG